MSDMKNALLELFQKTGLFSEQTNILPVNPVASGEKVLGSMNTFERSCYTLLENFEKRHKFIHDELQDEMGLKSERDALEKEHAELLQHSELIRCVMFTSIRRFELPEKSSGWGLRENAQVVALFEKEEKNDDFPFSFGFGFIRVKTSKD